MRAPSAWALGLVYGFTEMAHRFSMLLDGILEVRGCATENADKRAVMQAIVVTDVCPSRQPAIGLTPCGATTPKLASFCEPEPDLIREALEIGEI